MSIPKTAKKTVPEKQKPVTLKYKINTLLGLFSSDQQQAILNQIKKADVSEFILNRIRRTEADDDYSPAHDHLLTICIVMKRYNPVFKRQLGFTIETVDDLLNRN